MGFAGMMVENQKSAKLGTLANDAQTIDPLADEQIAKAMFVEPVPSSIAQYPNKTEWSATVLLQKLRCDHFVLPTIVAAAIPLINLAHALRLKKELPDSNAFRNTIINAVTRYARDLETAMISREHALDAHYIVCATIDDVLLSLSWGVQSGWAQSGLVSTFHMSVTGGERVFELLESFSRDPETNHDLLVLIYLSLSLAFEGRTRIATDGPLQLIQTRNNLYKILQRRQEGTQRELSSHSAWINAPHKPLRSKGFFWSVVALLLLVCICGYLIFTLLLDEISDNLRTRLNNIPIREAASITLSKPAPPPVPAAGLAPPAPVKPLITKASRIRDFRTFLQPDIDRMLLTVTNNDDQLVIRIYNSGLFANGSAEVNQQFSALLQRIGNAITAEDFHAMVIGYTDNVPIHTAQFPSNQHLSAARARAVGDILTVYTGPSSILTEGRGDSDPIADNKTAAGRQMNRRIEIVVLADPDQKPDTTPDHQQKTEAFIPSSIRGALQ